ncbi:MAG: LysR substrate-binding domain-containing protein [Halothermotrichaceae bacterium]
MDIECLEYFKKIAEIKSISKVADKTHISQPALSQKIQKLENSLGQKLFVRSNRGVKLTQAGEIVLKYADNIIRTYNKMINGLTGQQNSEIKIEADSAIATYCLPCALLTMKDNFPSHNYNLISGSSDEIEEDILNDICEVGFITRHPYEKKLVSHNVIEEKVVLISPKDYEISEKICLEEVLNHSLIILKEECIIKENLEEGLNNLGHKLEDLHVIARLETTEAIKTLVKRGYGLAFVPYDAVKEEYLDNKLQISRIKDYNLDYNVFMINKSSKILNSETREFIEGFKKIGNNICC